ncbi:retrovirus-related pol polyprotein from transposon TNT 1-94 [Tanacetum coccineum]
MVITSSPLCYGKLIYNSIINDPYVKRMIPKPGDENREVAVNETFHEQTDDELTKKELKQVEADDQAIQTILLGVPEDIYAAVDSFETAQEIWLRVQQMMKGSDIGIQEKKAKFRHVTIVHQTKDLHITDYTHLYDFLKYDQKEVDELRVERLGKTHDPLALMVNSNNPYNFLVFPQDQPSPITYMQQQQPNNNFIPQPSFIMYSMQQPMQNPEDITNPTTSMNMALIAQPGNQNGYNAVQNIGNQNPNGNGNVVAARAEGNAIGNNGNQIWCYNCRGLGHFARNCTVRPRRRDTAYLQTQLLISQKEEVGIQLQAENFDLMAAAADLDEIEETDKAPVYDPDGLAEVHNYNNCYDDEIFNMFTQEEQYTKLLEPIPEPHQVQQNDSNVISDVPSVEQNKGTVEQSPATVEDPRALYDSLYNKLAIEVENVNSVNRKMKATNAELTTELARYKNQEKFFEINQEKYEKLERYYQKSFYQEQCLTKKVNALHLSSAKMITTLNEEIENLNNMLSKEKSTVSSLQEENKRMKTNFKIHEDKVLDKQIQVENKVKELDNILVKTGQSIQTMHMLSPKPDSFYHTKQKMALGYQNPFYLKQAQQKQ